MFLVARPCRALPLKGRTEKRQMPVALDPPQARFDVQQRRGHPPLLLVTGPPVIDLVRPLADLGHDRLQAVGGLQAARQGLEHPQPV